MPPRYRKPREVLIWLLMAHRTKNQKATIAKRLAVATVVVIVSDLRC
jgi:hypothetical protein